MQRAPPVVLNAALSEDRLQIAVDLTNPDVPEDERTLPGGEAAFRRTDDALGKSLTIFDDQLFARLTIESFAEVSHGSLEWLLRLGFHRCLRGAWAPSRAARAVPAPQCCETTSLSATGASTR